MSYQRSISLLNVFSTQHYPSVLSLLPSSLKMYIFQKCTCISSLHSQDFFLPSNPKSCINLGKGSLNTLLTPLECSLFSDHRVQVKGVLQEFSQLLFKALLDCYLNRHDSLTSRFPLADTYGRHLRAHVTAVAHKRNNIPR